MQALKKRLEKISAGLNISIKELHNYKKHKIKNLTLEQNDELKVKTKKSNKLKILKHLENLEHIFKISKKVVKLVLLEMAKETTPYTPNHQKKGRAAQIYEKIKDFITTVVSNYNLISNYIFSVIKFFSVGIAETQSQQYPHQKI